MRIVLCVVTLVLAACSGAEKQKQQEQAAKTAIAAESTVAAQAKSLPITGKWDEAHLVERLVRAGLAPQAMAGEKGEPYWKVPVHAFRLGPNTLFVYLYADSVARRAVTSGLDTLTGAPKGTAAVYPPGHVMIVQNNLAAVMVGGTEAQIERVTLALEAGLPAPPRP